MTTQDTNTTEEPSKLFRLNAQYIIDPECSPNDLINDTSCFLSTAFHLLELSQNSEWSTTSHAAQHFLEMAMTSLDEAQHKANLL